MKELGRNSRPSLLIYPCNLWLKVSATLIMPAITIELDCIARAFA